MNGNWGTVKGVVIPAMIQARVELILIGVLRSDSSEIVCAAARWSRITFQ
ncbi:MAG TPA: hypothetical protein VJR02_15950 [Pyrinomonadaceae bacterium]|nr:hypothetical protein [Pyrinomonadaceae bacterium]